MHQAFFFDDDGKTRAVNPAEQPPPDSVGDYGKVVRNSPNAQVEGFAVAGADGVWQRANR